MFVRLYSVSVELWSLVGPWDDRQYIMSNGKVTNGKTKLKTCMATHEVTDGPLADAPELSP
jgi:hypothetical protein